VGRDEGRVDRQEAELAAHGAGMQQGRFAQPKDRDVHGRSGVVEADVLEVVHEEDGIAIPLGRNGAAYHRAREAEFGQRMHRRDGRRHGFEIELEVGIRAGLHVRQELRQIIAVADLIGGACAQMRCFFIAFNLASESHARRPQRVDGGCRI
jgi:hypothetical protein